MLLHVKYTFVLLKMISMEIKKMRDHNVSFICSSL